MVVLDRLRLFEKAMLPLVLMAALFAVTIGMGVVELHRTVASYRETDPPSFQWTPMLAFRSWRGVSDGTSSAPDFPGRIQARGR